MRNSPMNWNWFLFGFKGRINRAKYWLAGLVILCWMIFLGVLVVVFGGLFGSAKSFEFSVNDIFLILDPAAYHSLSKADLFTFFAKAAGTPLFAWVYVATSIKRLHDRDKAGWWMIPFFVAPSLYKSRSRNSAQGDKWNFCLTAGTLCLRIRSDHEQTSTPEPHTGLQGKGGACRRQG